MIKQSGESISTSDIVRFVGELKSLVEQLNHASGKTNGEGEKKQDFEKNDTTSEEEDSRQKKRYQEELERVHKKQDELQRFN